MKLQRVLPLSPAQAWTLATEPDAMNLWSEAEITLSALGASDDAFAIGTSRYVTKRPMRLLETIVDSRPPLLLVYRAAPVYPLREHEGRMTFTPQGDGTLLEWSFEATFVQPLIEPLVERWIEAALNRSLDRMVLAAQQNARIAGVRPIALPVIDDDVDQLWTAAMVVLEEQRQLAHRLSVQGSPLQWFARAYVHVTDLQMQEVKAQAFLYPGWVLRLLPVFHRHYITNLRAYTHELRSPVEAHWQRAFDKMKRDPFRCVAAGAYAHIEEDLPRSLAEVALRHYPTSRLGRFRGDYMTMWPMFREAGSRLIEEIPLKQRDRLIARMLSPELRERLEARIFYNIPKARRRAFERAERMAALFLQEDLRHAAVAVVSH